MQVPVVEAPSFGKSDSLFNRGASKVSHFGLALEPNINDVSLTIGKDKRLSAKFLQAGVSFSSLCFKKDIIRNLAYLAATLYLDVVADY